MSVSPVPPDFGPPHFVDVFLRVADVVLFSVAMVGAVGIIRRLTGDGSDSKQRAASTLWPRAKVWVLIAATLLGADAGGPLPLALLMAAIAWVAAGELVGVGRGAGLALPLTPGRVAAVLLVLAAGISGMAGLVPMLLFGVPATLFVFAVGSAEGRTARAWSGLGLLLYLAVPLASLIVLRERPDGFVVVAWIILVVCFNDVMAMFGGLLVGRTPLWPAVSPGKTVEGTLIGLVGALAAASLMRFAFLATPAPVYFAASLGIALAGSAGDLAASAFKRRAGVKDFGHCLPGHGGVMDRLDSLLFAAPVAYVAAQLL